ncbi:MAG TPA: hypothetical protein VJ577_06670 [Burkholderiaceae bacterium]|nr:hypothetical protein [Burkholderiaceae bacterium]
MRAERRDILRRIGGLAFSLLSLPSQEAHSADELVSCSRLGRLRVCVTVPLAIVEEDAMAKLFQAPASNMAKIYIFRRGTMAAKTKSTIIFDGASIATLAPMTYTVIEAAPGVHHLTTSWDHEAELELNLEPGKNTFVENTFSLLFFTMTSSLKPIDEQLAKAAIAGLNLVKRSTET